MNNNNNTDLQQDSGLYLQEFVLGIIRIIIIIVIVSLSIYYQINRLRESPE
jgi:hypothetical protein